MKITLFVTLLFVSLFAVGQAAVPPSPPPTPQPLFAISTQAIALHIGGQTVPATDAVGSFYLTQHVILQSDNILAPANDYQGYFGGIRYNFSLNNLVGHTNIPKDTFQPYLHGAAGVARNVPANGPTTQHYGFLAGGGFDYDPLGNAKFSVGPRIEYLNSPGFGTSPHGFALSANLTFVLGSK